MGERGDLRSETTKINNSRSVPVHWWDGSFNYLNSLLDWVASGRSSVMYPPSGLMDMNAPIGPDLLPFILLAEDEQTTSVDNSKSEPV